MADHDLPGQVEPEVVRARGGPEQQRLGGGQPLGLRGPGEVELVVQRVDAGVADVGVQGVLAGLAERCVVRRAVGVGGGAGEARGGS